MQIATCRILSVLAIAMCCQWSIRASLLPETPEEHLAQSGGVFRGIVMRLNTFEERGSIYTRALLRIQEPLKGKLPEQLEIVYRGGQLKDKGESYCGFPGLVPGEERIFFVSAKPKGRLYLERGEIGAPMARVGGAESKLLKDLRARTRKGPLPGADLRTEPLSSEPPTTISVEAALTSTATNLVKGIDGLAARFLQPDRGKAIPYLVDADYLPAGVTLSQAVWAVSTALGAWTNVSSLRFGFAGLTSFGKPAADVTESDGVLRIALHDHYNYITGGDKLGVGGNTWVIQNTPSGWTTGGNVSGNDFHATTRAFVVLEHEAAMMQNLTTLTEVLAHEIGHALGLGHSSHNDPEPVALLNESIMYYRVRADGRGARLNDWDINVCRQAHPLNTPPFCFSRYLDVITGPTIPLNVPGVNSAQVPMYDLQTSNLGLAVADASSRNGTFHVQGNWVNFEPFFWYSDSGRSDPGSGAYYDDIYVRCSDGEHASPWGVVGVVSLSSDSFDEGVPDWWRNTWFGNPNPNVGSGRRAHDDFDLDGFDNITEWRMGSDPTSAASNLRLLSVSTTNLQFQARPFDVYEVLASTNMIDWTPLPGAVVAEDAVANVPLQPANGPRGFFKVRRVP